MEALIGVLECGGFLTILLADVIQEFCVQRGKAKTKSTLLFQEFVFLWIQVRSSWWLFFCIFAMLIFLYQKQGGNSRPRRFTENTIATCQLKERLKLGP